MGGCRHPFETLLLLQPEFDDGGWLPFLAIFLVYIQFNVDMDTSILPNANTFVTTVDGVPQLETGFTWKTNRVLRYSVGVARPTVSLTFAVTAFPAYIYSATGLRVQPHGPFDIFKPWTGPT